MPARKILDTRHQTPDTRHILKRSEWESAGWEFQYLGDGKRVWGAADDIKETVNSLPDVVFKEGHTINHHVRGLTGLYRELGS